MPRNDYICAISGKHFIEVDAWRSCRDNHDCQNNCPYEKNRVELKPEPKEDKKDDNNKRIMSPYELERMTGVKNPSSWFFYLLMFILLAGIVTGIVFGINWLINH
jgi:hypothetical protein